MNRVGGHSNMLYVVAGHNNMVGDHSNGTGCHINILGGHSDGVDIIVACLEAIWM